MGISFISFWTKRDTKWAQREVFQVLWKINAWNFSDFFHEVTVAKIFEITQWYFEEKSFTGVFLGKKEVQNPEKCIEFFRLYRKLQYHKLFWQNFCFGAKKVQEWGLISLRGMKYDIFHMGGLGMGVEESCLSF